MPRLSFRSPMNQAAAPCALSLALFALLIALLVPVAAAAQTTDRFDWQPEGDKEGCQIATSTVAGKDYLASKASCVVSAQLDDIGEVLREIPRYSEWMHDCRATAMLRVVDRDQDIYIFWYHQHIPLLTDRDMVLKSEVTRGKNQGRRWASIIAASTRDLAYNPDDGFVRMPSFTSEWQLEEIDATHTRVSFMINPDFGGGLPTGLTNLAIAQAPFKSIQGLIRQLRQRQQQ